MIKPLVRSFALAALALGCTFGAQAQKDYGLPENVQDCNILHLFCWSSAQIIEELPAIAEAGFGAIQISPIQGNANRYAQWYYAYMPYDFAIRGTGACGSKEELKTLCDEAAKYGIKVIVDVVANHINKASGYHAGWWNVDGRIRWEGAINYSNRNSITHGQLGDYGDVVSENPEVQERAVAFVQELKDCGVAGIRWDAAKHIGLPSEGCDFWPAVTSVEGLYHYGEILDGAGGGNSNALLGEYAQYMTVTDTPFSNSTLTSIKGNVVPTYGSGYPRKDIVPAERVIYWGESHDTFANNGGSTKLVLQNRIDRAWAINACHEKSNSLYLSRSFKTDYSKIAMGMKGETHFMDPEIAAVNHLRNAMVGTPECYTKSGRNAVITRGGGGALIVCGKGESQTVTVANGESYVPAGTYTDRVSGNTFTVTESEITGTVGDSGIAVIYPTKYDAGVDGVQMTEEFTGRPEYYTLQGVRVEQPAAGFYIVRRGNKVSKEFIR